MIRHQGPAAEGTGPTDRGKRARYVIPGVRPFNHGGYTLVELTVVMVLIGIVLAFSAPRLKHALLDDALKAFARNMVGTIHGLRNDAVREQQGCTFCVDLNANKFWTISESMTVEEQAVAREQASSPPAGISIRDLWIMGKGKIVEGDAHIVFTPRGYAQASAVHLRSEDGREMTLEISPFISKTTVHDAYVEYD